MMTDITFCRAGEVVHKTQILSCTYDAADFAMEAIEDCEEAFDTVALKHGDICNDGDTWGVYMHGHIGKLDDENNHTLSQAVGLYFAYIDDEVFKLEEVA